MIDVLPEWTLNATDESQISTLLSNCFPTDYGGRSFFHQRPHLRVVWRGPEIVAHLALFFRSVRLGDDLVEIVGVGDVATMPDVRGRGIASLLLERGLAWAEASTAQYAILFGERGLYRRAGFEPVDNPFLHLSMTGAVTGNPKLESSAFFRVKTLTKEPWKPLAKVDFLGPLF